MAVKLTNKTNAIAATSKFPYGRVRDEDANTSGTPVNQAVYQDHHTFFQRLMEQAGRSFNGLLDNSNDGFQLYDAFLDLARETLDTSQNITITFGSKGGNNVRYIELPEREKQVYTVDFTDILALEYIAPTADMVYGEAVVLFFEGGLELRAQSNVTGGNLGLPANLQSLSGVPYVFRYYSDDSFYLESAFHHLWQTAIAEEQLTGTDIEGTLTNNWTVGTDFGAFKKNGWVSLYGSLNSGDDAAVAATLPLNWRPRKPGTYSVPPGFSGYSNQTNVVNVSDNGEIFIFYGSNPAQVELGPIGFYV
jgi:hypothetical protein